MLKYLYRKSVQTIVVLCLFANSTYANEEDNESLDEAKHSIIFEIHNDLFSQTDRHYSNGIVLGIKSNRLPKMLRSFMPKFEVDQFLMTLSHEIYHPDDIADPDLIEDDSPYAGFVYLTFSVVQNEGNITDYTRFRIGFVGPHTGAEDAQTAIHSMFGNEKPLGWEHQLKTEFGINITKLKAYNYNLYENDNLLAIKSITYGGGSIGSFSTKATVGQKLLLGYNLPDDMYGTIRKRHGNYSAYASLGVEGSYVVKDIFLDGNTYRDSHSVSKKPFTSAMSAGVTFRYKNLYVSYEHTFETRKFKEQKESDAWGSVYLQFNACF